jgi:hypothetical protein
VWKRWSQSRSEEQAFLRLQLVRVLASHSFTTRFTTSITTASKVRAGVRGTHSYTNKLRLTQKKKRKLLRHKLHMCRRVGERYNFVSIKAL